MPPFDLATVAFPRQVVLGLYVIRGDNLVTRWSGRGWWAMVVCGRVMEVMDDLLAA